MFSSFQGSHWFLSPSPARKDSTNAVLKQAEQCLPALPALLQSECG